jgi:putative transposase
MGLLPTGYLSRGVRAPVALLTRYEASRSVSEPAAHRKWPSGSRLKALGRASVATLDLLLLTVAKTRRVHQDGGRFQSLRSIDPTLAAYVGEDVPIRYDPRDMAEIRVYTYCMPLF